MTLTLLGLAPPPVSMPTPRETPRTAGGRALLALLRDMVGSSIDLDPDLLHSTLPAGRAVLTVTAAARAYTGSRGGESGIALTEAPGIVVMRDLVRVLDLLEGTVPPGDVPRDLDDPTVELPDELADAYESFLQTVGRDG